MTKTAERILRGIFRVCRYHAWIVLAVTLAVTGASLYYIREVPLRSSYFDLLPERDPLVEKYRKNQQYLAQTDTVALLLSLRDADTVPVEERERPLLDAAKALTEVLRQDAEFVEVSYTLQLSRNIPEQYRLLYELGPEKLASIQASVATAQSFISGKEASLIPTATSRRPTAKPATASPECSPAVWI